MEALFIPPLRFHFYFCVFSTIIGGGGCLFLFLFFNKMKETVEAYLPLFSFPGSGVTGTEHGPLTLLVMPLSNLSPTAVAAKFQRNPSSGGHFHNEVYLKWLQGLPRFYLCIYFFGCRSHW